MFFFLHPRKVASDKAVAVKVVQNRQQRQPVDVHAPVLVVETRQPPKKVE
ncbi:MAG TPA: hypothetical protein VFF16_16715 [Telluria sp.]|nr:hypothetical protein [Telluria sp.]